MFLIIVFMIVAAYWTHQIGALGPGKRRQGAIAGLVSMLLLAASQATSLWLERPKRP